jgi:hypothetical protein
MITGTKPEIIGVPGTVLTHSGNVFKRRLTPA